MSASFRDFVLFLLLMVLGFALHHVATFSTFSLLPVPIILSGLISYTFVYPFPYLVFLAFGSELFSDLTPGLLVVVVLTPWLVRRLVRAPSIDLSMSWLLIVASGVFLQLFEFLSPDIFYLFVDDLLHHALLPRYVTTFIPWFPLFLTFVVSSLSVFIASIVIFHRFAWKSHS